jgi:acetylornithine deacetylase/succinyl-diaminopimelate desuccinylase-like protein
MLSIDRRTIPGEKSEDVKQQFQNIIDKLSEKDSEFKATVEIKQGTETSYTGLKLTLPKDGLPWKIEKEHPFVKAAAEGLKAVGQEVKYDYWIFGTDMSVTAGIYNKPCIGYSPMQEQYAHTPYDKVRIDYMKTALEGNISIFFSCANTGKIIGTSI